MRLLYTLGIWLYSGIIQLAAALGHTKARKWRQGRLEWRTRYQAAFQPRPGLLWMHVSSLGEFEQGRPVLEAFRARWPRRQIVLTFFSPSGYDIRKDYPGADFVGYLPADTPRNARDLVGWLQPGLVIWVKYDFWANHLDALRQRDVPVLLISAFFRPSQIFFKWYGAFWRQTLRTYTAIFLQKDSTAPPVDPSSMVWAGDTRIDRVLELARQAPYNPIVAAFAEGRPTLIAGSTWAADESMLLQVLGDPRWQHLAVVIAPHDVREGRIRQIEEAIGAPDLTTRYSRACATTVSKSRWLIVDNIGLLNTLYRYGWVAYIGGGFGKGIHNTLEPAAWGLPVLFGPRYHTFAEAVAMRDRKGAFPVQDAFALERALEHLSSDAFRQKASDALRDYLLENKGATKCIIDYVENELGLDAGATSILPSR